MRLSLRISMVLGMCLSLASAAAAQSAPARVTQSVAEPNTITVTPFVGVSFGTSDDFGSSIAVGAAVAYDFTRNFGVEFDLGHAFDIAGDDPVFDYHLLTISGNAVYHFDMPRVTPYATVGIGWEHASAEVQDAESLALYPPSSTEIAWNFGGGVKYPLTDRLLLRADIRRFQVNDIAPDHWRFYGGLTFWVKRN